MYVPAERNFITNVKKPKVLNLTSDSLVEFVTEFDNAKNELKGPMRLPINDIDIEYNKFYDLLYLKGKDYKIKLTEASSGFQSLVPLYLVSWFLANSVKLQSENAKELMSSDQRVNFGKQVKAIIANKDLTNEQKRIAISEEAKRFNKTAFINIIEEPEQNLFPTSQKQMLTSLLEFNNMNKGNKLIMSTHSPYIIDYLTIAIQGEYLKAKINASDNKSKELIERLNKIVPLKSLVSSSDVVIYELDEINGSIKKLSTFEGIPSDNNYLNNSLAEGNEIFGSLLEIEEDI